MVRKGVRFWKKVFSAEHIIVGMILVLVGISTYFFVRNVEVYDYIVETNAFFAPFEFYENRKIVGVDVEIVNRVAEKLGAKIQIKNVEFDVIIDNVANGVIADAGVAGLTITPARAEKVDFSIPYYTSVQYVIFSRERAPEARGDYVVFEAGTTVKGFDSHQLAADAIGAKIIDFAIADQLAAEFIVSKNPELMALPLYYAGEGGAPDEPVEESYAVAVNKQTPELLAAFNEVLTEMLVVGEDGKSEMDKLILKYMGLIDE